MEAFIKLALLLVLTIVGFWRGRRNEQRHLLELAAAEKKLAHVLVFPTRYPANMHQKMDPVLVTGAVVVGSDHFRLLVAALRKVVGGNFRAYENLLDRGRRQALVRLKEDARARGASMVFGLRYVTSHIAHARQGQPAQVEVIAYGTAFVPAHPVPGDGPAAYQAGPSTAEADAREARKNRFTRWWALGWLACAIFVLFEPITANFGAPSWRYAADAPWVVFALLACLPCAGLLWAGRRRGVGVVMLGFLALLSVATLSCAEYFLALSINTWGGREATVPYTLANDGSLQSADPAWPALDVKVAQSYWLSQPAGERVDLTVRCGLLGFCQYDIMPLRERAMEGYLRRSSH